MRNARKNPSHGIAAGLFAGLAGALVLFAMRKFDEKYAPKTLPEMKDDPAKYLVRSAGKALPLPRAVRSPIVSAAPLAYGALMGGAYALACGSQQNSALRSGALLGASVYAVGYLGWLPAVGLSKPLWKQPYPQIVGELLRHTAYGVATAAVFDLFHRKSSE